MEKIYRNIFCLSSNRRCGLEHNKKMNVVLLTNQIQTDNIHFLDVKKNIIIDGSFTKIIYCDPFFTMNGVFLYFPIIFHSYDKINKNFIVFNISNNLALIKQVNELENQILTYYKSELNCNKKCNFCLMNQLITGKIKLYKENNFSSSSYYTQNHNNHHNNNHNISNTKIVLKISGIWENDCELGITFKFMM
jgi:hypothetical protein